MRKTTVNTAKHRFTLVELLVSLGVLVIILGFILQFFIGSQRLWQSMEQRNSLYADARVAMDVMTTMLQNSFYSEGGVPFRIYHPSSSGDNEKLIRDNKIYFATKTEQNLSGEGNLKYVSFQLCDDENHEDELKIAVFGREDGEAGDLLSSCFPPYLGSTKVEVADVASDIEAELDKRLKNSDEEESSGSVLVRNAISFEIIPYEMDTTTIFKSPTLSGGKYDEFPFMVVLKLTLLSPADFKIWHEMGGFEKDNGSSGDPIVEFRKTHAYTFSRTVFLGEQSRTNINK